jgi:hypothetical protein
MPEIPEYLKRGYITPEELFRVIPKPSEERLRAKPVAVPECPQEIPCAPCREVCPHWGDKDAHSERHSNS